MGAVMVSFGIVQPWIAPLALITQTIEYRMKAYRMTWVTSLPFPAPASGVAEWIDILELIIYLVIIINALLMTTELRTAMDDMPVVVKLMFAAFWSMSLVIIKAMMKNTLRQQPADITEAMDVNAVLHETIHRGEARQDRGEARQDGLHLLIDPFSSS